MITTINEFRKLNENNNVEIALKDLVLNQNYIWNMGAEPLLCKFLGKGKNPFTYKFTTSNNLSDENFKSEHDLSIKDVKDFIKPLNSLDENSKYTYKKYDYLNGRTMVVIDTTNSTSKRMKELEIIDIVDNNIITKDDSDIKFISVSEFNKFIEGIPAFIQPGGVYTFLKPLEEDVKFTDDDKGDNTRISFTKFDELEEYYGDSGWDKLNNASFNEFDNTIEILFQDGTKDVAKTDGTHILSVNGENI